MEVRTLVENLEAIERWIERIKRDVWALGKELELAQTILKEFRENAESSPDSGVPRIGGEVI